MAGANFYTSSLPLFASTSTGTSRYLRPTLSINLTERSHTEEEALIDSGSDQSASARVPPSAMNQPMEERGTDVTLRQTWPDKRVQTETRGRRPSGTKKKVLSVVSVLNFSETHLSPILSYKVNL